MNPFVSIIIINLNGKKYLEQCLDSLSKISYPNYEIILVDNNSNDDSVDFTTKNYPNVSITKLPKNKGFAEPNNIGANLAKGDLLLFLNNDTKVTKDFLQPLVDEIQLTDVAICQSLLLKLDGVVDSAGDFVNKYGISFNSKTIPKKNSPILSARGACMIMKKKNFCELGGFDEKFFVSFEDVDIGWRAWILGYRVMIVPKSIVYHYGGSTIATMSEVIKFHGTKNNLILRLTNFEFIYGVNSIISLFFITLKRKIFGMPVISDTDGQIQFPSLKIIFHAIIWIFKNWKYISKKKKQISLKRRCSTTQLINFNVIRN